MAKFGVGDTVIGNSQNCHGVTCEGCVITVTKVGPSTFSGIIDEHPDNSAYEGQSHDGMRYEWFNLVESAADIMNSSKTKATPPKRFTPMQAVNYEGERVHVHEYGEYVDGGWSEDWEVEILYSNGETVWVDESDLEPWVDQRSTTTRVDTEIPADAKIMNHVREVIIVTPAHPAAYPTPQKAKEPEYERVKPAPIPIKEHYVPTPSYENVLDRWGTKKRGHIPLKLD